MLGRAGLQRGLRARCSPALHCLGHAMCRQHAQHLQQAPDRLVMCAQSRGSLRKAPRHMEAETDPSAQLDS